MNEKEIIEKKDKGTRSLFLPSDLSDKFKSIRTFGNFSKFTMHSYYHYFYSVSVGFAANNISKSSDLILELNNLSEIKERDVNSIDSPQLEHHDDFFKTIAYWYLMKKDDKNCYKILTQTNEARKICEMLFKENWDDFFKEISNFDSDYPDIQMLNLIEDKIQEVDENKKEDF